MKKHKKKIIWAVSVILLLVFVYWWGGSSPGLRGWNPEEPEQKTVETIVKKEVTSKAEVVKPPEEKTKIPEEVPETPEEIVYEEPAEEPQEDAVCNEPEPVLPEYVEEIPSEVTPPPETVEPSPTEEDTLSYYQNRGMEIDEKTGVDIYNTTAVPEGKPIPIEPQNAVISDRELTCTLSVRCDTVFNNMSWLNPEKVELLPENGVIFAEQTVTFYEGESVFNLLVREMKRNKIHLEFENTPVYNSAYIEGINNLYEFDCGELSGWMYRVNGWFPNYGCSRYQLKEGDCVEWIFTCNLGRDVGGFKAASGE